MRFLVHPARVLSLLVLIAIVNVYVFAGSPPVSSGNSATTSKVIFGKLITTSNRPILVNGGEAITGTTIFSGAQLMTSAAGGAAVQLDKLGTVMISPASQITLSFDAKSVAVKIASGHATLTTAEGVKGTVVDAKGLPTNAPSAPTDADTARNWGIAGVAIGSAAFIWALIAWNKANDANDRADALAAQLAALRACLAGQTASPVKVCTSF